MKTFSILFFAVLIAGSNLFETPDAEIASKYLTKSSVSCSTVDTVIVPAAIQTSFNTKYPKASKVTWYQYTPDKTQTADPTAWYYGLDEKDYYVTFYSDDADYIAWYDNGTWIRSSQNIDNIDLPADVMRAINTQYPGFRITDVDLERDNKMDLYQVKLVKGDTKWKVHYTPTGNVVRQREKHLTKSNPQAEMTSDFSTRYSNASEVIWYTYTPEERVEILPTDWDYGMDASDYEVRFKMDGSDYQAWYNDGKWIRSEVVMSNPAKLPANINSLIQAQYSGYTIKD